MKNKPLSIHWKVPMSWKRRKRGRLLVELSDRLLKVIQVTEEDAGRRIVHLEALALDVQDVEAISRALSSLLKHLPKPIGQVFASVPRSQITTRMLLLPSTHPSELAKMVAFQVEKEIPFPKERIIFDHHLIEITPEGYTRLLLVIAGKEVIHRYLEILKQAGLTPASLFFSSQGLASWFQWVHGEREKETFSALIDVDRFLTHVEVIHRGELYFTRSFLIGSQQIEEKGEKVQEAFLQELNRTFLAFKKEFQPKT
ncbi:pilus assembly protein PilM, partial [candidate division TA06 bacterium]|nr:pilus assembly protein PilM [candidate division TA06 bacterium]